MGLSRDRRLRSGDDAGDHCFLRPPSSAPHRRSQSHWSSYVRQVRMRGLRRDPLRRRSRLCGRLAEAGGGYRLNSRRWTSSDAGEGDAHLPPLPSFCGSFAHACGPSAVPFAAAAVRVRSRAPRASETCPARPAFSGILAPVRSPSQTKNIGAPRFELGPNRPERSVLSRRARPRVSTGQPSARLC
jgi:hypothetical protein